MSQYRTIEIPLGTVLPTDMFEEALRLFDEAAELEDAGPCEIVLTAECFDSIVESLGKPQKAPPALVELFRSVLNRGEDD